MSESFAERLSRLTPDASRLDRDALLFAAGRASAQPSRLWGVLAGSLALSQVATLALLWPRPVPSASTAATMPTVPVASERSLPPTAAAAELWALKQRLLDSEGNNLPPSASADPLVPADPPLRAFSASAPSELE